MNLPIDRQTLEKHKGIVTVAAFASVLLALFVMVRTLRTPRLDRRAAASAKAFYSTDDGKTWFPDAASKIPPFEAPGGIAYRARVCKCRNGQPFVNNLERYPDDVKKQLEGIPEATRGVVAAGFATRLQVKRLGESQWVSPGASPDQMAKYNAVVTPRSPDCRPEDVVPVFPQ